MRTWEDKRRKSKHKARVVETRGSAKQPNTDPSRLGCMRGLFTLFSGKRGAVVAFLLRNAFEKVEEIAVAYATHHPAVELTKQGVDAVVRESERRNLESFAAIAPFNFAVIVQVQCFKVPKQFFHRHADVGATEIRGKGTQLRTRHAPRVIQAKGL